MVHILKKALNKEVLISLCIGKVNWHKRIIGYIESIDDESLTLSEVDIYGAFVRKSRILLSRITIVEIGDSYNNHLEKLKKVGEKIRAAKNEYLYNRGGTFLNKLVSLIEKKSVCTFFFDTEYVFGVALRLQDNFLVIKAVSYRGTEEGEIYCNSDAITKVRYNGPMEEKISCLLKT